MSGQVIEHCPICGASPVAVNLTNSMRSCKYQCCSIQSEPQWDWPRAIDEWNQTVKKYKERVKEEHKNG